jgi:hypothetical protein
VSVTVHYVATGTFPMAAGQWDVLLEDGSLVPLVAADPNAMGRTLNAGERFDLKASADISATPKNLFVVYVDTKTSEMILAVPIS